MGPSESNQEASGLRLPASGGAVQLIDAMIVSASIALDHVRRGGDGWHEDKLFIDAVSKRVEQIGELAKDLSAHYSDAELYTVTSVNWRGARAMRDVVVHDYERLDVSILSTVIAEVLPPIAALSANVVAVALASEVDR